MFLKFFNIKENVLTFKVFFDIILMYYFTYYDIKRTISLKEFAQPIHHCGLMLPKRVDITVQCNGWVFVS